MHQSVQSSRGFVTVDRERTTESRLCEACNEEGHTKGFCGFKEFAYAVVCALHRKGRVDLRGLKGEGKGAAFLYFRERNNPVIRGRKNYRFALPAGLRAEEIRPARLMDLPLIPLHLSTSQYEERRTELQRADHPPRKTIRNNLTATSPNKEHRPAPPRFYWTTSKKKGLERTEK